MGSARTCTDLLVLLGTVPATVTLHPIQPVRMAMVVVVILEVAVAGLNSNGGGSSGGTGFINGGNGGVGGQGSGGFGGGGGTIDDQGGAGGGYSGGAGCDENGNSGGGGSYFLVQILLRVRAPIWSWICDHRQTVKNLIYIQLHYIGFDYEITLWVDGTIGCL